MFRTFNRSNITDQHSLTHGPDAEQSNSGNKFEVKLPLCLFGQNSLCETDPSILFLTDKVSPFKQQRVQELTVYLLASCFYAHLISPQNLDMLNHSRELSQLRDRVFLKLMCQNGHISFFLSFPLLVLHAKHIRAQFATRNNRLLFYMYACMSIYLYICVCMSVCAHTRVCVCVRMCFYVLVNAFTYMSIFELHAVRVAVLLQENENASKRQSTKARTKENHTYAYIHAFIDTLFKKCGV